MAVSSAAALAYISRKLFIVWNCGFDSCVDAVYIIKHFSAKLLKKNVNHVRASLCELWSDC